ncbi:MAG: hypothetical protein ACI9BW_004340, partial [Gammaproteobacteria bacterium]
GSQTQEGSALGPENQLRLRKAIIGELAAKRDNVFLRLD